MEGNLIGTKRDGISGMGNTEEGVEVSNSDDNTIGGTTASVVNNTVAFNRSEGVGFVGSATGNRILGNSIFFNASLGINLGDDGRTDNDDGDTDLGTNDLQNFPVLTSARTQKERITVKGNLNSIPQKAFTI